jgi:hypothetical protein
VPSDQTALIDTIAGSQSRPDNELKDRIRFELAGLYTWPSSLLPVAQPLIDLSSRIDLDQLLRIVTRISTDREVTFAIVSKEYVHTGLNWIHAMQRLGLNNFLIVAGDTVTATMLNERGIPNILAVIDESTFDPSFVSTTGFSAKGLAVSAFKFPVAHFLVQSGYSVVLSDADAVWLRDPMPCLRGSDLAFQRIVYHPPAIATQWGFAACGGFISFRSGEKSALFLDHCIQEQQILFCDQVAINLALLEGAPDWNCDHPDWIMPSNGARPKTADLEFAFGKCAQAPISGVLRKGGLSIQALPHDTFWRHGWVEHSMQEMIICHPNSPKDDLEKVKLLGCIGACFPPGGPALT